MGNQQDKGASNYPSQEPMTLPMDSCPSQQAALGKLAPVTQANISSTSTALWPDETF